MSGSSAESHGQHFVFADSGEGPLVVLLHGFPDTPFGWEATSASLNAAGYRTVAAYLRGYHPDTIVPERRYRTQEIGEDAVRLLDALGADRAVLVGHDWGAAIAYRAAVIAPERVRGICAVAIPHPRLLGRSLGLLWRGRHFITLSLPSGPWLARRRDFAYIDTLMRRWAPNWSGPERESALAAVKRAFRGRARARRRARLLPRCLAGRAERDGHASRADRRRHDRPDRAGGLHALTRGVRRPL
jgi:pimeloyl-ACP methyl ester carboxylesterase